MDKTSAFRPNLKIFGVNPINPGWIYVVRNGNMLKIGKSKNPEKRVLGEARTWLPDLEIIGFKPFWNIDQVEYLIHVGLSQFWYKQEWFNFKGDPYYECFIEEFCGFYDEDRDMNSVDFIYWFNSSGMAEFEIERDREGISRRQMQKQCSAQMDIF